MCGSVASSDLRFSTKHVDNVVYDTCNNVITYVQYIEFMINYSSLLFISIELINYTIQLIILQKSFSIDEVARLASFIVVRK